MTSLDDAFTYHPPVDQRQVELYQEIRAAGKTFATIITDELADTPEREQALLRIREAVMWANASLAVNGC